MTAPLLEVSGLTVDFPAEAGVARAVDRIDFALTAGETVALVGESGCGKSVTSLAVMGLLPESARVSGSVRLDGSELLGLGEPVLGDIRGRRMAMIFQEPMTSLNPFYRVGVQVAEGLRRHRGLARRAARAEAVDLLRRVGLPDPERRAGSYPHELSGGMRQRVMIAIAIACEPALIIADEPTTALDVTVQAQILDLLSSLRASSGAALMLITHDLGVVAETADRVVVMYAGRIVERAPVAALFEAPKHPYTEALLAAVPDLERPLSADRKLRAIEGVVPSPSQRVVGCRFRDRCPHAFERCAEEPPLIPLGDCEVRCWLHA